MAKKSQTMVTAPNLVILVVTYVAALAILHFGHMNPFIVALMPCLALTFSSLLKR